MATSFDRKTVLSLKLKHSIQLRKLSRHELLSRLQLLRTVDPITNKAYKKVEEESWRSNLDDSPHGNPWHVSFHASQFPGDDPMACGRQALYRMLDFPSAEPFTRRSRQLMAAGKGIELELVRTWHEYGILISAPSDEEIQTGFEYPEAWLTGSVDAVIKPHGWNKPLPVEIKAKLDEEVRKMKVGLRGPDPQHINQIKVQLALIALSQEKEWPGLDPVTHGFIYYLSLNDPQQVNAEFRVDLDMRFFELGVKRLKKWREFFLEGRLPVENPSKKHPFGWRWSYPPCSYCPFKRTCQLDHQQGVERLAESVGIERAKLIREGYSTADALDRVADRWKDAKIVWRDELSERPRASRRFRSRQ